MLLGLFEENAMPAVQRVDVSFNRQDDVASQVAFEQRVVQFVRKREGVTVEVKGMNGKWQAEDGVRQRIVV